MQADLFPPASHNHDPISSHEAEQRITQSGERKKQMDIVYKTLTEHQGSTGAELTKYCDLDKYQIRRRLSDLREMGKVFRSVNKNVMCTVTKTRAAAWYIK